MPIDPRHYRSEWILNNRTPVIGGFVASDQSWDGANTTYNGFLNEQGEWYIQKQVVIGSDISWRYARGNSGYTTAWTGRAGLSYDYVDVVF